VKPTIRSFDLAHLAHVELFSPKPQESLDFFVNVMGMTESGRRGDSVYLRGWDEQPLAQSPPLERDRSCARPLHRIGAIALTHRSPRGVCAASAEALAST